MPNRSDRVVGVVQARMGSRRLPGKTLMPFAGTTVLGHLVSRLGGAASLAQVIVATSTVPDNDPIELECRSLGVNCFRGDEHNVLGRLASAAQAVAASAVVRITADDALMDAAVIDFMVIRFLSAPVDCATSLTTRSFPNGFVTSVFSAQALAMADGFNLNAFEREHVVPAFLARRDVFNVVEIEAPPQWAAYHLGLTLDMISDYTLMLDVLDRLDGRPAGLDDLLAILADDPGLRRRAEKNGHYWEPDRLGAVHRLSRP